MQDNDKANLFSHLLTCVRGVKALGRQEMASHQLSMNHLIAMRAIDGAGVLGMRELSEHLDLTPGACTQLVDRLSGFGLVTRQAGSRDRRAVEVALTPDGNALLQTISENVKRRFAAVLEHTEPNTANTLEYPLGSLAAAFETVAIHPERQRV